MLAQWCEGRAANERLWRFRQGGWLRWLLLRAVLLSQGIETPNRRPPYRWQEPPHRLEFVNFHTFRHTFATWMRKYGGADLIGLVGTGNWRDPKSVARYAHVVPREEWDRVERLPEVGKKIA